MKQRTFIGMMLLMALAGCRLGPRYELPCIPTPEAWKASHIVCGSTPPIQEWWEIFEDDILNTLEEQAILSSPTLNAALERVTQARAAAGVRNADLYPQITLDPRYSNKETAYHIHLPRNLRNRITPLLPIGQNFRIHQIEYSLPLDLSYQIDLWGKLRGQYESAFFNAEAQEAAFYTVMLTLTTDLASAYFQMRTLDAQIKLYRETLEARRNSLALNESRYKKGLANYIDVTNASVQLTNVEADYYEAIRQRVIQENTIALLMGTSPSELCLAPSPLDLFPPQIPAGIPSDVLLQRPDIAEAERTMAAQHALIGVAYASFFPSLTLSSTLGLSAGSFKISSRALNELITWQSRLWAIAANVTQSILDGGRNCANLAGAKSAFRESVSDYQQQVLTAFNEVEDALNNLEWQEKEGTSLHESVQMAKKTTLLSRNRYKNGVTNYLEVVVNQTSELDAERRWIGLLGARYQSTVQLIKALGGTWLMDQCGQPQVDSTDGQDVWTKPNMSTSCPSAAVHLRLSTFVHHIYLKLT